MNRGHFLLVEMLPWRAGARWTKATPEPSTLRLKYKEVAVITIAVGAMFAGKAGMWRLY